MNMVEKKVKKKGKTKIDCKKAFAKILSKNEKLLKELAKN